MAKMQIGARVDEGIYDILDRIAKEWSISRSESLRRVVKKGLDTGDFGNIKVDSSEREMKESEQSENENEVEIMHIDEDGVTFGDENGEKQLKSQEGQLAEEEAKKQLEYSKKAVKDIFESIMEEKGIATVDKVKEMINEDKEEKETEDSVEITADTPIEDIEL